MFGFTETSSKVRDLVSNADGIYESEHLLEVVKNLGLSPSILENIPMDDLMARMEHLGVDPADLTKGQLLDLIENVQETRSVDELDISDLLQSIWK
jgi:hypothetical protein